MNNLELSEQAKQALQDLLSITKGQILEHEQSAYNRLRLICERLGEDTTPDLWAGLPKGFKFMATDEDGGVWIYQEMPEARNGVWRSSSLNQRISPLVPARCSNWKESLIQRPIKETPCNPS